MKQEQQTKNHQDRIKIKHFVGNFVFQGHGHRLIMENGLEKTSFYNFSKYIR